MYRAPSVRCVLRSVVPDGRVRGSHPSRLHLGSLSRRGRLERDGPRRKADHKRRSGMVVRGKPQVFQVLLLIVLAAGAAGAAAGPGELQLGELSVADRQEAAITRADAIAVELASTAGWNGDDEFGAPDSPQAGHHARPARDHRRRHRSLLLPGPHRMRAPGRDRPAPRRAGVQAVRADPHVQEHLPAARRRKDLHRDVPARPALPQHRRRFRDRRLPGPERRGRLGHRSGLDAGAGRHVRLRLHGNLGTPAAGGRSVAGHAHRPVRPPAHGLRPGQDDPQRLQQRLGHGLRDDQRGDTTARRAAPGQRVHSGGLRRHLRHPGLAGRPL